MIAASRAVGRVVAGASFLSVWTLAHALVRPLLLGEHRREAWRRSFLGGASRVLLRLAGVEVRVQGDVPRGAGVLVTNHLGYLDVLVLASVTDTVFVSRADVRAWPLVGPLTRWSGTVYLDRQKRTELPAVVQSMQRWIERDTHVVFFPEGTSGSGDALLPFRSSLFEAAVRTGAPLRCAALHYATTADDPPARDVVSWWGDMAFLPHVWGLVRLRGVRATVRFAPEPVGRGDRKATARSAEECVRAQLAAIASAGGGVP
jgi:lyso-ornithine lipid O-acyltransferase